MQTFFKIRFNTIDLNRQKLHVEPLADEVIASCFGGKGLATHLLLAVANFVSLILYFYAGFITVYALAGYFNAIDSQSPFAPNITFLRLKSFILFMEPISYGI